MPRATRHAVGGWMYTFDPDDPLDEFVLDVNMEAVRGLTCDELRLWLDTMDNDLRPYKLPKFIFFGHLFSEHGGDWPVAHPKTKYVFREFAEAKLALC